jgi:hypothetical protein
MTLADAAKVSRDFKPKLITIFGEIDAVLQRHGIAIKVPELRLSSGGAEALLQAAHPTTAKKVTCKPSCVASGDDGVTCGVCCKWTGNP